MENESYVTLGLSFGEVDFIKTCIQFTKHWAKCFDNEQSQNKCDFLLQYLNECVEYEKGQESSH